MRAAGANAASGGAVSIGGTGVAVRGGSITTLTAGGATRNTLDDGAGNAAVAGTFTTGGNITVNFGGGAVTADSLRAFSNPGRIEIGNSPMLAHQAGFFAGSGFGLGTIQATAVNYNMLATDAGVFVTTGAGAIVITLKSTNGAGTIQFVQKVDAGAGSVTLTPDVGTIDGAATKSLNVQNMSAVCCFDGANWHIIAVNTGVI